MEEIASLQNARIKQWTALHEKKARDESGLFLVEGDHLIPEALSANAVKTIITDDEDLYHFEHSVHVTPQVMKKLSRNVSAVHHIAVCRQMTWNVETLERVLILDDVQDPGNLGTLIRTAASFSFDAVYLSEACCDLYNEKTIRSTQGALFHIPVVRTELVDLVHSLQKQGVQVIATTLEDSKKMQEIPAVNHMAFILGNEGQGVHQKLQTLADERLRIEMHGFESLNVAVAGGIVMYHYRKD